MTHNDPPMMALTIEPEVSSADVGRSRPAIRKIY